MTATASHPTSQTQKRPQRGRLASDALGGGAVARLTGLEPATPGVTGRYSNQLNYHSITPDMAA